MRPKPLAVGLILGAVVLAGCTSSGPADHPGAAQGPGADGGEVVEETDFFKRTIDTAGYTREENYFPTFNAARVKLQGDLRVEGGSLWVYVMDGSGRLWNFNRTWTAPFDGSLDFVTDPAGEAGVWMISFCFVDFAGQLDLEVTPAGGRGPTGDPWVQGRCPA